LTENSNFREKKKKELVREGEAWRRRDVSVRS